MSDHHCCYIAATHYSGNISILLFAASHQPASLQEVNLSVYKVNRILKKTQVLGVYDDLSLRQDKNSKLVKIGQFLQ